LGGGCFSLFNKLQPKINIKFIKRHEIGQYYKNNSDIDFGSFKGHYQSKNTNNLLFKKIASTNPIIGKRQKIGWVEARMAKKIQYITH